MAKQQKLADDFHDLHQRKDPLVLFNVWDVATARAVSKAAPAVATSSGAVASALGFADGEQLPLDRVVDLVSWITAAVAVPVSVDVEAGYGDRPEAAAASVARIIGAGAVGINIEDGLSGGTRQLGDASRHAAKIEAIRSTADKLGVRLFINARTDPFLLKAGTPEECLEQASARAKLYADAGADGVFVPGLTDLSLIARLVDQSAIPVNIMVMSNTLAIADLANVGVRRVSLGPWPMMAAMKAVEHATAKLLTTGTYDAFLRGEPSSGR